METSKEMDDMGISETDPTMIWDESMHMTRPAKVITRTDRPISSSKLESVYKKRRVKDAHKWRHRKRRNKQTDLLRTLIEEDYEEGCDEDGILRITRRWDQPECTLAHDVHGVHVTRHARVWRWIKSWFR